MRTPPPDPQDEEAVASYSDSEIAPASAWNRSKRTRKWLLTRASSRRRKRQSSHAAERASGGEPLALKRRVSRAGMAPTQIHRDYFVLACKGTVATKQEPWFTRLVMVSLPR